MLLFGSEVRLFRMLSLHEVRCVHLAFMEWTEGCAVLGCQFFLLEILVSTTNICFSLCFEVSLRSYRHGVAK